MPKPKDAPAKSETLVDRALTWCKNNKFVAALIVFSVAITATARVADSIQNLFTKGSELFSHTSDNHLVKTPSTDSGVASAGDASIGKVLLTFGDSGIGPGYFVDPRSIAVDLHGNIYVAEYANGGRVQRFDSTGHFLNQWNPVGPKSSINSIAVDRDGHVYVAGDSLIEYNGENGQRVASLRYKTPRDDRAYPQSVQVSPTGAVATAWDADSDDVVIFDGHARLKRVIRAAVESHYQSTFSEKADHLVIDGSDNVYAFGHYGTALYKFAPDGKFLSRIGSEGTKPGQFHQLLSAAVDARGRLYVGDILSLQIFDTEGRFLRRVENTGWIMGMAVDESGALYTIANNRVTKFKISN